MSSQPSSSTSSAELIELVRLTRQQNETLNALSAKRFKLNLAAYCIIGLMFAGLLTAFWVLEYLITTSVGYLDIIDYVTGELAGSSGFESTEPLFIVTSRFVLGIGITWPAFFFVTLLLDAIRQAIRQVFRST